VAGEGKEGLRKAQCGDYDVIVLDFDVAGMDGLSLLKRLRADGRNTHV